MAQDGDWWNSSVIRYHSKAGREKDEGRLALVGQAPDAYPSRPKPGRKGSCSIYLIVVRLTSTGR